MAEGRPRETLVQYEDPMEAAAEEKPLSSRGIPAGTKKKSQLPPLESCPQPSEDILNTILPPREWIDNGNLKN